MMHPMNETDGRGNYSGLIGTGAASLAREMATANSKEFAPPPVSAPVIPQMLEQVGKEFAALNERIDMLQARLSPVLRVQPESPHTAEPRGQGVADYFIPAALDAMISQARLARRRLTEICERLEV